MTWIVICIVLLAAFGPVLWLLPSPRDRRLAALRARARAEGLVVELKHLPKLNASAQERVSAAGRVREPLIDCAAYSHGMQRRLKHLPQFRIQRAEDEAGQPRPGWRFLDPPDSRQHLEPTLALLDGLIAGLPTDTLAVGIEARNLTVYWLEGVGADPQVVGSMAAYLRDFEQQLVALDDLIAEESDREDS